MKTKQQQMTLICTGRDTFQPDKFNQVRNAKSFGHIMMKPHGGLWTSPIDSKYGWKDWCKSEDFCLEALKRHMVLEFNGTVYTINGLGDLMLMPTVDHGAYIISAQDRPEIRLPQVELDFCQMLNTGVDAIHLTERGEAATRFSKPISLYGWDCETVFVMNPATLKQIHEQETAG